MPLESFTGFILAGEGVEAGHFAETGAVTFHNATDWFRVSCFHYVSSTQGDEATLVLCTYKKSSILILSLAYFIDS